MYSIFKANSPAAAQELFGQVQCWHVAVVDDQCQFASDFKAVLRTYPAWLPVISLTNTWSLRNIATPKPSAVADAAKMFFGNIESENSSVPEVSDSLTDVPVAGCSTANPASLMHAVQEWSIKRKLLSKTVSGLAAEAMVLLFGRNPLSVDDWSSIMGVKPRRFQREFKTFTDLSPKKILALYHAYRIAFNVLENQNNRDKGVVQAYLVDTRSKERVMEYVLTHRSSLLPAVC
jgi:AraC-like DNA-binding protein